MRTIPRSEFHILQSTATAFGNSEQAGMALETHALLSHQSERRELEYEASALATIGVNSTGIGIPSNRAAVVS